MVSVMAWSALLSLLAQPIPSASLLPTPSQPAALTGLAEGTIAAAQSSTPASMSALEQAVYQQINEYRRQKGLTSLTLNATITRQARLHSQSMARTRALTHDGFSSRVQTISKTIAYRAAAENVAYNMGYSSPDRQAVEGWIKSDGHRQNIEGSYGVTGIGIAKNSQGEYYFTQIFIRQ